jgi:hypothetical protein
MALRPSMIKSALLWEENTEIFQAAQVWSQLRGSPAVVSRSKLKCREIVSCYLIFSAAAIVPMPLRRPSNPRSTNSARSEPPSSGWFEPDVCALGRIAADSRNRLAALFSVWHPSARRL